MLESTIVLAKAHFCAWRMVGDLARIPFIQFSSLLYIKNKFGHWTMKLH